MKTSPRTNKLEDLSSDLRKYVDLRTEQAKLKTVDGLSKAVSQCFLVFLIAFLALITIVLLSVAGMNALDILWGKPWGAVTMCGAFLLIIIILCSCSKNLFLGLFRDIFSDTFNVSREESIESQITEVGEQINSQSQALRRSGRALKKAFTPLSLAANIVSNKSNILNAMTLAVAVFSKIRSLRKKSIASEQPR